MARRRGRKRELRALQAPFTVAPPSGARIRDRLRPSVADEKVLCLAGEHLGHLQRADLAERVRIGQVPAKDKRRAERKKKLTAVSSSRWAGAMTRASEDQYQLSMRCLYDERAGLHRAIRRLAAPCGKRAKDGARGYADQGERAQKQRRARPDCAEVTSSRCSRALKTVRGATGPRVRIMASWPVPANNARNGTV